MRQAMRHPLAKERTRDQVAGAIAVVVLGAAISWSVWPIDLPELAVDLSNRTSNHGATGSGDDTKTSSQTPLDLDAFRSAVLWPIIDEPEPEPAPEPTGPPADLRLLGISRSKGGLQATVYDIANDRIVTLSENETIGDLRVTSVSATEIAFEQRGRSGTWKLENGPRSLREGGSGATGVGGTGAGGTGAGEGGP